MFKKIKKYYGYKPNIIRHLLIFVIFILSFNYKWLAPVLLGGVLITMFIFVLWDMRLSKDAAGNGILYGGRGKGKGIILNRIIKKDKKKPFVNVPYFHTLVPYQWLIDNNFLTREDWKKHYGVVRFVLNARDYTFVPYVKNDKGKYPYYHTELLINLNEYFDSIKPLTITHFVEGEIDHILKNVRFEGRNVYIDDINVYMPNWADSLLKNKYPSLPPFLAINRHIYGATMFATTQDRERPYKIIKELQTDTSIKAVKTVGWGFLWNCIPIFNYFVYSKYIYHELAKSSDMLPFDGKALINEGLKHGYLTSGQATKEVYEASNGKIRYGRILQLKRSISYDTRYFHTLVFGYPFVQGENKQVR